MSEYENVDLKNLHVGEEIIIEFGPSNNPVGKVFGIYATSIEPEHGGPTPIALSSLDLGTIWISYADGIDTIKRKETP